MPVAFEVKSRSRRNSVLPLVGAQPLRVRIGHDGRRRGQRGVDGLPHRGAEGIQSPAAPRRRPDDRDAQGVLKGRQVHGNPLLLRLIQQIDAQNHRMGALHHLERQVEVSL